MKIVFSSNVIWSIYNFRLPLLKILQKRGYEIHAIGQKDDYYKHLKANNIETHFLEVKNNNKNPIDDLILIYRYYKIYKKIKPDIVLHNSIKPNIYGTLAAGILKIPVINNVSGLGTLFISKSISTSLAKLLYKTSHLFAKTVFFQNNADLNYFVSSRLIKANNAKLLPGSGVDVNIFKPPFEKATNSHFNFIFIGRLLKDKGLIELYEAAIRLYNRRKDFKVIIVGERYESNETCISKSELDLFKNNPIFTVKGFSDNVYDELIKSDCLILPSYREGLSKVLIESGSVGIPAITSDVPGCSDVIVDSVNGFLFKVKNSKDLELTMEKMLELSFANRKLMGDNARKNVISKFSMNRVNDIYISEIENILCT